jgi:hypothetical protein
MYVRSCQILQRHNNKTEHLNIIMYLTVTEVTPPNVSKHSLKLKAIHFSMLIVLMLLTYIRSLPQFQKKFVSYLLRDFVFNALHEVLECIIFLTTFHK